eukprot:TRINITY_DN4307_c0_g1_i3.p1 TRINITY_DN4307_c0_g1~~TRINITY_DN4307_c0_g1_i3.p1  ORF type:complete len:110 (+),score=6.86 TRINITY_DN4307_c0_g1_i3:111-440(+)
MKNIDEDEVQELEKELRRTVNQQVRELNRKYASYFTMIVAPCLFTAGIVGGLMMGKENKVPPGGFGLLGKLLLKSTAFVASGTVALCYCTMTVMGVKNVRLVTSHFINL